MKTLIINNYLKGFPHKVISAVVPFSEYILVHYENIGKGYEIGEDIDALVLTGSAARIVDPRDVRRFEGEIDLIKRADLPCLGICYGHQLISLALGAEVAALRSEVKKFERVKVLREDPLFYGYKAGEMLWLAESHKDYVKKDSLSKAGLILLADSSSCEVEAVKHERKPFYGIQFHAEVSKIGEEVHEEGFKIIRNFFQQCVRR